MTVSVALTSEDATQVALRVTVREGSSETTHDVTVARELLARLGPGEKPEAFVERCFAFLLSVSPRNRSCAASTCR